MTSTFPDPEDFEIPLHKQFAYQSYLAAIQKMDVPDLRNLLAEVTRQNIIKDQIIADAMRRQLTGEYSPEKLTKLDNFS